MTNEAFARIWAITNSNTVGVEYVLPDRTKADAMVEALLARTFSVKRPWAFVDLGQKAHA